MVVSLMKSIGKRREVGWQARGTAGRLYTVTLPPRSRHPPIMKETQFAGHARISIESELIQRTGKVVDDPRDLPLLA